MIGYFKFLRPSLFELGKFGLVLVVFELIETVSNDIKPIQKITNRCQIKVAKNMDEAQIHKDDPQTCTNQHKLKKDEMPPTPNPPEQL